MEVQEFLQELDELIDELTEKEAHRELNELPSEPYTVGYLDALRYIYDWVAEYA